MNYIKEVVEKILPVEIGEEFNIILDHGGYSTHNPFKFTETDLVNNDGDNLNNYISNLMIGFILLKKYLLCLKLMIFIGLIVMGSMHQLLNVFLGVIIATIKNENY